MYTTSLALIGYPCVEYPFEQRVDVSGITNGIVLTREFTSSLPKFIDAFAPLSQHRNCRPKSRKILCENSQPTSLDHTIRICRASCQVGQNDFAKKGDFHCSGCLGYSPLVHGFPMRTSCSDPPCALLSNLLRLPPMPCRRCHVSERRV